MFKRLRDLLPPWHRNQQPVPSDQPPTTDDAPQANSDSQNEDDFASTTAQVDDVGSLVSQMIANHRYALLLRPQIAQNLTPELYSAAENALNEGMGLVPAGNVYLEPSVFDVDYPLFVNQTQQEPQEFIVSVQSVYLDRHPVTNREFQKFVNAGGYQEMAIWDPEIWPAVLDFADQSGQPGPRFWKNGRYNAGEGHLPVVGVSWYEAAAYARWVGKRLPTDAEWVKAGSWPVTLSPQTHLQRKYPWGDTFDRSKANVWGSQPSRIVSVEEFSEGVSVGGLYQLIGNVWEWNATTLETNPEAEDSLPGHATLLKSIRGGAFDTYFEHQATCNFASGENPIMRKHNIGFRCALSMCDIAPPPDAGATEQLADVESANSPSDSPSIDNQATSELVESQAPEEMPA